MGFVLKYLGSVSTTAEDLMHQQKARVEYHKAEVEAVQKAKEKEAEGGEKAEKKAKTEAAAELPASNWGTEAAAAEEETKRQKEEALAVLQKLATPAEQGALATPWYSRAKKVHGCMEGEGGI